jgi:hypothetical protein
MPPVGPDLAAGRRAWSFHPTDPGRPDRDDLAGRRVRIAAALRAGHAVGAGFRLTLEGGPAPRIRLGVGDLRSGRWFERALAPAYGAGRWRKAAPPPELDRCGAWTARRRARPAEPPRTGAELGTIARRLALTLATLGTEVRLELDVRPRPFVRRWPGHWLLEPGPPAPAGPAPAHRTPDPRARPAPPPPGPPPLWESHVSLFLAPEVDDGVGRSVRSGLEIACVGPEGVELLFGRSSRTLPGLPRVLLAEEELLAWLPPEPLEIPLARPLEGPGLGIGRGRDGSAIELPLEPGQGRHLAVLGETGMGKSSLLVAIARRAAGHGAVVLFDPIGETAGLLAGEVDPDRLLRIAPGPLAPALNALGLPGEGSPRDRVAEERRVTDLVAALRRVRAGRYSDGGFWGPRLEEMLGRAIRAAVAFPGATLEDAHTLLATEGRTRSPHPPEADGDLRELAARVRERPDDAEGARRLLYEVVRNPTLAAMVCSRRPSLRTADLVRPGRVTVISGEAAVVGEGTARYLLAIYLALLWSELLARPTPAKTFVLLDEAQWFAHESLAEMLRLARRRDVHVALSTQSIASLPEPVRDAVWTNVADFVAFRGSPEEARDFARLAPSVRPEELLSLGRGEALVLAGKGHEVRWMTAARLPVAAARPAAPRRPSGDPAGSPNEPVPAGTTLRSRPDPLEWIRELRPTGGIGPLVPVSVVELGRIPGFGPTAVRVLGARLGRAGAIVRTTRDGRGSVWWIDPGRLPPAGPAGGPQPS